MTQENYILPVASDRRFFAPSHPKEVLERMITRGTARLLWDYLGSYQDGSPEPSSDMLYGSTSERWSLIGFH